MPRPPLAFPHFAPLVGGRPAFPLSPVAAAIPPAAPEPKAAEDSGEGGEGETLYGAEAVGLTDGPGSPPPGERAHPQGHDRNPPESRRPANPVRFARRNGESFEANTRFRARSVERPAYEPFPTGDSLPAPGAGSP